MNILIMDMGDNVSGECSLEGYRGKLELMSFNHGVLMYVSSDVGIGDRTGGKATHQDLSVIRYIDAASPVLNQACCAGRVFPKVEIILGRNESGRVAEYLRYTLKNVIISSISTSGGGEEKPSEVLTLNYNHITWKYTVPKTAASAQKVVEGGWDVVRNQAS